jgi:CubicO group peptidase (beta-lactamase class C family)
MIINLILRIAGFGLILFFQQACMTKDNIHHIDGSRISVEDLSAQIQSLVDTAHVTGLGVSILNENEIVYQNAFGYADFKSKELLRTDHVFYGASFSKAVFGYLVAQLAVEGVIDLDKPLQQYLDTPIPDYQFEKEWRGYRNLKNDRRYEKLTARMCLSHTTGFPNWRWMTKDFDFYEIGRIRFLIDPGERFSYSGEGINLLQFVLEKITNKGLEELASERIFKPLKMGMTSYVWQTRFSDQYCSGHSPSHQPILKDIQDEAGAAGSMETTIEDYTRFFQAVMKEVDQKTAIGKLMLEPNVRIKSKAQFGSQSWEDTDENDAIELSYGLGWGLLNSPYGPGMFKEGHDQGFQHYSIMFPDQKIGVIIMTNCDNGESIFKDLLEITIGDVYTPWKWERYIPYDTK